jgi:hypothetical protein
LGRVRTRHLGKNFLTSCSIGRVRSCVRPVCAANVPLALMLCADRVPIKNTYRRCADPSGLSLSPDRPCLHYVVVSSPIRSKLQLPDRQCFHLLGCSRFQRNWYSTSILRSWRRPQHQNLPKLDVRVTSAFTLIADSKRTSPHVSSVPAISGHSFDIEGAHQRSPEDLENDCGRPSK